MWYSFVGAFALGLLSASRVTALDPLEGYVFFYFTGNSLAGENVYLAASNGNNALSWTELNNASPILTSSQGTRGLRDPFIIRSPDGEKFFLLATDLSIGSGTPWGESQRSGSRYIEIWESSDLVNWGEQRHVLVSGENAGMTWAPEAYWDEERGEYLVFWASALYASDDPDHTGASYNRMMYAATSDFVTFGEPQIWQDSGDSRIDSTVLRENGVYYRFTKDEGAVTGCRDIIQEHSPSLSAQLNAWETDASCIGAKAGTQSVEGPTIFKANPGDQNGEKFYLFLDEYGGRGYIPLETDDIANPQWTVSSNYALPGSPRHGTVLPVTAAELERVRSAYGATAKKRSLARKRTPTGLMKRDSPVLEGLYADPNIAVFGCSYYIYATTDGYEGWGGRDFYVWKSDNLANWTRAEEPFLTLDGESGNVPWADGNAWAPTITERDGKYYFYFSGNNPDIGDKTIGVAVADAPEGPFTAESQPMITGEEAVSANTIDPAAFHDPVTGKYYLLWGNGSPIIAELNDDMVSLDWSTAAYISGLVDFREGVFLNYREGIYHLTYSIDDTGSPNYKVGYATADNAFGPYTYQGVILEKDEANGLLGTGHSSIVNVPGTDEWYIAYHRFAIPDGDGNHRETTIDVLTFDTETGLMEMVTPTVDGVAERVLPGCEATE